MTGGLSAARAWAIPHFEAREAGYIGRLTGVAVDLALLSSEGPSFLFRWVHLLTGITWIGLLYYFNFVQVPFMGEAGTEPARPVATRFLVPRALWWFRWGAVGTWVTGFILILLKIQQAGGGIMSQSWGYTIQLGMLLGTIMFLNVWLIIWPKQKIVIASAEAVAAGGQADPNAAEAGKRAFMASRTNTLFSIPMLFFMGAASHLSVVGNGERPLVGVGIVFAIIAAAEANAIWGKRGEGPAKMLEKHVGVIHVGLVLAVVFYLLLEFTG
ncbi:MAG: urate hydroxylase PuuD [Deltaproteobacteria bacterium]|nr:urate hydroxylase PuuD [Deltaproteobacteria bacterium]